jgi:hypothetical protein
MASTPVRMTAPAGLTLTAEIYALDGNTIVNGTPDSCTEATVAHGQYDFTVAEALAGFYRCNLMDGSDNLIATGIVYLEDTNTQRYVQDDMAQAMATLDGKTQQEALRYIAAMTAGKCTGAGTGTETFVGLDGSTNRVQLTIASSNRTAVSLDP